MNRRLLLVAVVALVAGGVAGFFLRPAGVAWESYQSAQDQSARLQAQVAKLTAQVDALRGERDRLQGQNDELTASVTALQDQVASLKSEVAVAKGQNADLASRLAGVGPRAALLGQLLDFFSSPAPFDPAPPATVFRLLTDGTGLFLQFDRPGPEASRLRYLGTMVPGRFCADEQYAALSPQGYVHFRALTAPSEATAPGGRPGEQGYWMRFIALDRFETPWGTVEPGLDLTYRPTDPPDCPAG